MAESVALTAGEKIGGCLIEHIQRELGYLFCFNNNIQELETRLDQLKATTNDVQAREDEAKRSWKTLGEAANQWMVDANGKITEADTVIIDKAELQKGCFSIKWCPNIKLRFSLGRKGKKLALDLEDLLQRGRPYLLQTLQALHMPPINMRHDNEDDTDFDSRRKPMEEIIEMLLDKETRLIGICGMGGIGKTTFVNQVLQKVQDFHKHLFDFQFMLIVSSNPTFRTIQQQALEKLDYNSSLTEKMDEKEIAQLLLSAFDKKKVVVVLDDVWEEFDLNEKGFPLKKSNVESCCKIIYTSRKKDLWASEQTKKEISLHVLSGKESLDLFIRKVNLNDNDDDFLFKNEIARKIVEECKGLPLALEVAGGALVKKEKYHWENMFFRLNNHHEHHSKINEVLKTSYESLENNEKLLFLLCCLFQEDANISIERLYRFSVGLQVFKDMNTLREIRSYVYSLVGNLITRNLLIKDIDYLARGETVVKIHDVIRDIGISIANYTNGFCYFVSDGMNHLENVIGTHTNTKMISILFSQMDLKIFHKMGFKDSKFELLKLDDRVYSDIEISEDFFQGVDILEVLDIVQTYNVKEFSYSSFPNLVNIKMLSLEYLNITTNLSSIRHLGSLKILSLRWSFMNVLPNEISELTNLELLDLTGCKCFISKGILCKLTNLQELYMWSSFSNWRVPKEQCPQSIMDEDNYAAAELIELNKLNNLWRLELNVSNIERVQKGITLLSSSKLLECFKIRIGEEKFGGYNTVERGDRQLLLENIDDNFSDELGDIIKNKITNLCLYKSSVIWKNMHLKEFLKDVELKRCESVITLFPHSQSSPSFSSNGLGLRSVKIYDCNQMRHLFDISILRHLKKLQVLDIKNCEMMEEVVSFCQDREQHKIIEFNSLETLTLDTLCKLGCFSKGIDEIHFYKLKILELKRLEHFIFPAKIEMFCLKQLVIKSIPNIKSLCNLWPPSLEELTISDCEDFIYVFSFTNVKEMEKNIFHLSKLRIRRCQRLKGLIHVPAGSEEEWNKSFSFPNLQILHLKSLYELTSFIIHENEEEMMQSALFYHDQVSFPCLQDLKINELPKINYIVKWNDRLHQYGPEEGYTREIQQPRFPNLKLLSITYLMELVSFVGVVNNVEDNGENQNALFHDPQVSFPCLEELIIMNLPKINYIVGWNDKHHNHHDTEGSYREIQSSRFPCLKQLTLISLDELLSFDAVVNNLDGNEEKENALFHPQVSFPCLTNLKIFFLRKINYIVGWNGLQQQRQRQGYHGGDYIDNERKLQQHIMFPILKKLWLFGLSSLIHMYESNHPELGELLFQNMSDLEIGDCQRLRYLFSEKIIRGAAKHLEILDISNCQMMDVVMKNDDEEYVDNNGGGECTYVVNNRFLPLLEKLSLRNLLELKRFCNAGYTWVLPMLRRLEVHSCPKLDALSEGCLNCPKLEILEYDFGQENAAGDINNTLRHLFNRNMHKEATTTTNEFKGIVEDEKEFGQ